MSWGIPQVVGVLADELGDTLVLTNAYVQITKQRGDVIQMVLDVAAHDNESAAVLATARRRHNRNLAEICCHLEDIGASRDDVDAPLAPRIITYSLRTQFHPRRVRRGRALFARVRLAILSLPGPGPQLWSAAHPDIARHERKAC